MTTVFWNDARTYKGQADECSLSPMMTTGELYKDIDEYVVLRYPLTYMYDRRAGEYVPRVFEKEPTFFFVPKGMIERIEEGLVE